MRRRQYWNINIDINQLITKYSHTFNPNKPGSTSHFASSCSGHSRLSCFCIHNKVVRDIYMYRNLKCFEVILFYYQKNKTDISALSVVLKIELKFYCLLSKSRFITQWCQTGNKKSSVFLVPAQLVSLQDDCFWLFLMVSLHLTRQSGMEYGVRLTYGGAEPHTSLQLSCLSSEPRGLPTPGQITLTLRIPSHGATSSERIENIFQRKR